MNTLPHFQLISLMGDGHENSCHIAYGGDYLTATSRFCFFGPLESLKVVDGWARRSNSSWEIWLGESGDYPERRIVETIPCLQPFIRWIKGEESGKEDELVSVVGAKRIVNRLISSEMRGREIDYMGLHLPEFTFATVEELFSVGIFPMQLSVVFGGETEAEIREWTLKMAQAYPEYIVFSPCPLGVMFIARDRLLVRAKNSFHSMEELWRVKIHGGVELFLPPSPNGYTTYVTLEQEGWCDAEWLLLRDIIRPGMGCVDVGASFGVYAHALAKYVGESGRVWAFEPSYMAFHCLRQQVAPALVPLNCAVGKASGRVSMNTNDIEFAVTVRGESIQMVSLDDWWQEQDRPKVDFLKIDANRSEVEVIEGGLELLKSQRPLVLCDAGKSEVLVPLFEAIGFSVYQYNAYRGTLLPWGDLAGFDKPLNLIACPDNSPILKRYLCMTTSSQAVDLDWQVELAKLPIGQHLILQSFTSSFSAEGLDTYYQALCAVLAKQGDVAESKLVGLNLNGPHSAAFALLQVRALLLQGKRTEAFLLINGAARHLLEGNAITIIVPVLPPLPQQDHLPLGDVSHNDWFAARILEAAISLMAYSTFFAPDQLLPYLKALVKNPAHQISAERALALVMLKLGKKFRLRDDSALLQEQSPNLHAWRKVAALAADTRSVIKQKVEDSKQDLQAAGFSDENDTPAKKAATQRPSQVNDPDGYASGLLSIGRHVEAAQYISQAIDDGVVFKLGWINYAHVLAGHSPWEKMGRFVPGGTHALLETGWVESVRRGRPVDKSGNPIPWFTYPAIDFLDGVLRSDWKVLEWGSGNSTLWWAKHCSEVLAIDNNEQWFAEIRSQMPGNVSLQLLPEEARYINYPQGLGGMQFDVIVIDGVFRNQCAFKCLDYLSANGIVVFDNTDCVEHAEGVAFLNRKGLLRIDFFGLIPSYLYRNNTSVFLKNPSILTTAKLPTQLHPTLGMSCGQVMDRSQGKVRG